MNEVLSRVHQRRFCAGVDIHLGGHLPDWAAAVRVVQGESLQSIQHQWLQRVQLQERHVVRSSLPHATRFNIQLHDCFKNL